MKAFSLIVFLFFLTTVSAQELPFSMTNFTPLPGTVLDTPDYEGSDPRYLSANRSSPLLQKGFILNMAGTGKTALDLDLQVHSETNSSSNLSLMFPGASTLTFLKSTGLEFASMNYSFSPNPGMPVNIRIFDMNGEMTSFNRPQGNIGSLEVVEDSVPGAIDTSSYAPYLTGIIVRPELTRTLVKLLFHNRVRFNISGTQIVGTEMHFYIERSYSQLSNLRVTTTNIAAPISVYDYAQVVAPPMVNPSPLTNGYGGDEFVMTGNNLAGLESVSFAGVDVLYQIINNNTVKLILPNTYTSAPFMLKSDDGTIATPHFMVMEKPKCDAVPHAGNPFFYFETPESIKAIWKWEYNGHSAASFQVRYRNDAGAEWTVQNVMSSREFSLNAPQPFTTYSFQVRANCPNGLYSEWSETAVLKIEYTDMIEVSKGLNKALITWMNDSIDPDPLDSFLGALTGPAVGTLDQREVSGFVDRFFERVPTLYSSMDDLATTASISCICKVVTVDLSQVYEARQDNFYDYGDEHLQKGKYQVGFRSAQFRYYGAAQRNRSNCMDYDTRNGGKQARRHTESWNRNEVLHSNGDTPYTHPQTHAKLRMTYLCANATMVRSMCGCEKKVYVTAEVKADICAAIHKKGCKGHAKHDYGGAAESSFGGIITTGVDYGADSVKTLQNMQILAAGHHNIYKTHSYNRSWNPAFVQKGISLLFNATLAVLTAGTSDVVQNLINQGYMSKAVNDLATLLTTNPYNITFEEAGTTGCKTYSIIHPADPFFITLQPNQERFVNVSTVSFTRVTGWGCYYDITADMHTSYHLAAATDRYAFEDKPSCCINPTATYATRFIDGNFNPQRGGIGHQERIETFLYHHGDREPLVTNPNFSAPVWIDPDGNRASVSNTTAKVKVWDSSPIINEGLPAGRLSGKFSPCRPEMLRDILTPIGGGTGGHIVPVTLRWAPSISVYRTGYFIEKGYHRSGLTTLNAVAIDRDSSNYTDSVDLNHDSVYYRIYAVNANNNTASDYSEIVAVPLSGPLLKKGVTALNDQAENSMSISLLTYPNPSSGSVYITYKLPEKTSVNLVIYDMNGRKVRELINGEQQDRGVYILQTDMKELAKGQYVIWLKTDKGIKHQYLVRE